MPSRTKSAVPEPSEGDAPESRRVTRQRAPKPQVVDVTAVLVAHDGAEWLPEALAALARSTRVPAHVVCVDTGSTDGSAELLEQAFGDVLRLPRDTGFGAAVAEALHHAPAATWVWLLHDDVCVEPTALQALLEEAEASPSCALLGPKVRDWNDPRYLVEIGITTDAAGHRETGLERREYDQGQHDHVRDVLAVGTAAALVRRDVWDAVGGLDPELPVFRDDLDLGWKVNAAGHRVTTVPSSLVRHARAATTGHRETAAAPGRATGTDRRHAVYVLLAHASGLRLLGLVPRLILGTVLRSLLLVLTRQVADAGDEWRALLGNLGRPAQVHRARRARARTRTVSQRTLRPLFASRTVRMRARMGALSDWMGGTPFEGDPSRALGDPGPDSDDFEDMSVGGTGALRRLLVRPGLLLTVALGVLTLLAERSLLGAGTLGGGALTPTPGGASDLWRSYTGAWHDVSVGSGQPAPPGTAAIAALSTLLLGKPGVAIDVLLLASVPLAGVTAYLAASRMVRHLYLRLWAAATWALIPVATGAIAVGRLDAAAVQIALPLLVLAAGRVLTDDPRVTGWWRAWALGLGLGVTSAFAPQLWPLVSVVLLVGAAVNLALAGGRRRAFAALIVVLVPGAVLYPWSLGALSNPSRFVMGPQLAVADLPSWHLLALSPGGPGVPAAFLTLGVTLAGLAGTVRKDFRRLAHVCWGVALLALGVALALSRATVDGQPVWPGVAVQVAALAVITSALVAASGARTRLAGTSFGWRQLMAGLVAVAAGLAPLAAAAAWAVRGADDPLHRTQRTVVPLFAAAELAASPGLRVLVLSADAQGRLDYSLTTANGSTLDLTGLRTSGRQGQALDAVVADLGSPRGSDAAEALSTRAVRYVALRTSPGSAALESVLDSQSGLVRRTRSATLELWQVVAPTARLQLLPRDLAAQALGGDRAPSPGLLLSHPPAALAAGPEGASTTLSKGSDGRLLVLADAVDGHWKASVDGVALPRRTAWGWAQAFVLPADGGHLQLSYSQTKRHAALVIQVILVVLVAVLSAPSTRRRRGLEDDLDAQDEETGRDQHQGRTLAVTA
jgi:GT2 family glycosyltransferase